MDPPPFVTEAAAGGRQLRKRQICLVVARPAATAKREKRKMIYQFS